MILRASGEDYLEAILILQNKIGMVRSVDLAQYMGYSKASISAATSNLRKGGFLVMDNAGYLTLTETGRETARKIYERHKFFTDQLIAAGIDPAIAEQEACKMEHAITYESFEQMREAYQKKKG